MKRILVIGAVVGVIVLLLGVFLAIPTTRRNFAITGYDGPVGGFVDVEWDFVQEQDFEAGAAVKIVAPTDAQIYLVTPDWMDILICTGLRAEMQVVPNVLSQEVIDTISKSVLDEEAETNTTTTVEIWKAKCNLGLTVETWEGGLAQIKDVTFWLELQDNADSIFSSATDRYAYIVEVYNRNQVLKEGSMTVVPTAQGAGFVPTTITEEEVPQWLIDAGYQASGSQMTHIKIPIKILSAVPIQSGNVRLESYTTWDIGFDVIMTAKWVHVSDYKEWGWPELPDFWGTLLDAIAQFAWYIAGIVVSIVVILKVKDPRYIALLLGIMWLVVLWQTGALHQLIGWFGL